MLVPREGEPGLDDPRPLLVLEPGHVLADLAEAAERDHAQETLCHSQIVSGPLSSAQAAAGTLSPARSRHSRTRASSSSVAGTSGSRGPPTSGPRRLSAVLMAIGLGATLRRSSAGSVSSWIRLAPS